jgi:predicted RNase H-like HicB family nuclease
MRPDSRDYAIAVRHEVIDGEDHYVGRVLEWEHIAFLAYTPEAAYWGVRDAIDGLLQMHEEDGCEPPVPDRSLWPEEG